MPRTMARWSDGTCLIDFREWEDNLIDNPLKNLTGPRNAPQQKRLDAFDLADEPTFRILYETWLGFSAVYNYRMVNGILPMGGDAEDLMKKGFKFYTKHGIEDAERSNDLDEMLSKINNKFTNNPDGYAAIKDAVQNGIPGTPLYIQMRVIAACALMNRNPDQLFIQGQGWPQAFEQFLPARLDDLPVGNGDAFILDFASHLKAPIQIRPRSLFNDSGEAITLSIRWDGKDYPLRMPPHGKLRVIFGDSDCKRLLGLKGNISFNVDSSIAIVQQYSATGMTVVTSVANGKNISQEIQGIYDAFPLNTGFAVQRKNSIEDQDMRAVNGVRLNGQLPVRCFAAGGNWARLYEDGTLVYGNQGGACGSVEAVSAVEIDGAIPAIAFYTREGRTCTWVYGTVNDLGPGQVKQYFDYMMDRFRDGSVCESATNGNLRLNIDLQGNIQGGRA